ncbi:hypothetical protein GTZ97_13530 [Aquabacterium fontiphilum]|uniref:O-antigen ligase family protein n=1 Tax=Aquabacterium fontiphilum TaxID=450365 RepID=UPI001378ED03|nr:O-antigen ligase family protein [Aquabacterium fontiphilum]NBD21685.1 hypothetical protein [Aquabacterium fontiphilum]
MSTHTRAAARAWPWWAMGLAVAALVGWMIVASLQDKASLPLLIVVALAGGAGLAWHRGNKRRLWLGLLFFTAPFSLSKALVPPLDVFYSPGWYLSVSHVVLFVLAGGWVASRLWIARRPLPLTALDRLALCFLAWIWVTILASPTVSLLTVATGITYSLCVLGYYVVSHAIEDEADVRAVLAVLPWALGLQFLLVLAQMATSSYVTLPGAKVPMAVGTVNFGGLEAAAFRPIGAFDHPNALADYLTLLLAPALAFVLMGPQRIAARVWWVALGVLGVAGVMLLATLSRGGWAAFALAVLVIAALYWRLRVIGPTHLVAGALAGVALLGAILVAYPQVLWRLTQPDDRSTESRLVLNDQALTIIRAQPLTGVGFGQYSRAAHEHIPPSFATISEDYQKQLLELVVHNHYLLLAAELGVPAMLFWVYLMWRWVRQAWPLSRWRDPGTQALAVGLVGALVSQMLFLASDNYYADVRVFMLWLTAGLLQALCRLRPTGEGRP